MSQLYAALRLVTAIALFAMAGLTFVDVIGRYFFNAPIPGTFETVGLLLGVVTFAALPLVTRGEDHITVDLFDGFIRGRFRMVRRFAVLAGGAIVVGFMAWRLWATALDEYRADYVTEYFGITRAPLLLAMSLLCVVTCAIQLSLLAMYAAGRQAPAIGRPAAIEPIARDGDAPRGPER